MNQRPDLDFAIRCRPFNQTLLWALAVLLALAFASVLKLSNALQAEITSKEAAEQQSNQTVAPRLSDTELHALQLAHDTQKSLNIPWQSMLTALEKAQAATPDMRLLGVQPNPAKGEIIINGVVSNFNVLSQYIEALKAQPEFSDAALSNQHWDEAPVGQEKLSFMLTVTWRRNG